MRTTNALYALTTLAAAAILVAGYARGASDHAGMVIVAALLGLTWWAGREARLAKASIAIALILFTAISAAGATFTLAGLTHDTYLHVVAAFAVAMLLDERLSSPPLAVAATLLLGVGVEALQWLLWDGGCTYCPYWHDVAKDLLNDALGALLWLVGRAP